LPERAPCQFDRPHDRDGCEDGAPREDEQQPGSGGRASVQPVLERRPANLDAWALYRNNEIMMLAQNAETAELLEERLFEPDIARSKHRVPPQGVKEKFKSWRWNTLGSFL
jgi:hypothetical protein